MNTKLGFVCKASYGHTSKIPKDYFDSYYGSEESKYITLRTTFKFKEYFREYGELPLLVIENEVEPLQKEDIYTLGGVNIFDRAKFNNRDEGVNGMSEENLKKELDASARIIEEILESYVEFIEIMETNSLNELGRALIIKKRAKDWKQVLKKKKKYLNRSNLTALKKETIK